MKWVLYLFYECIDKKSKQVLKGCSVPGTVLNPLQVLAHLILTKTP